MVNNLVIGDFSVVVGVQYLTFKISYVKFSY